MRVAVTEAKAQLTELVRRAEAGEPITLTRHGRDVARITPVATASVRRERRAVLDRAIALARPTAGPDAARSADFLYGDDGLPA
jgi:prevent-host-death family protein